jgi:hypothetical protein
MFVTGYSEIAVMQIFNFNSCFLLMALPCREKRANIEGCGTQLR